MKILITKFLFIFFIVPFGLFAQKPEEKGPVVFFINTDHDFGRIAEQDGEVKVDFKFANKGSEPLVIENVEASCGCTSPVWSTDSIMPGEEGFIQVAYDPHNRPGPFNKTVTVTSNGNPAIAILTIEGMVLPTPKDIAAQYPYKVGKLCFSHKSIHFGNITNDAPVTKIMDVYNSADQIITFLDTALAPSYIAVNYEPKAIEPGEVGQVNITFDGAAFDDLGYSSNNIRLYTYELEDSVKEFNVFATVLDYFAPLSAEALVTAPKIAFDKVIEDFGNASFHETVNTVFMITNQGKEPLELRKIKPNCTCIKAVADSNVIQPGDSTALAVSFSVSPIVGTQQKMITVFSNDPTGHAKVLTLKAYVRE